MDDYDLVVIGGGAAGLGAVRTAARRKARVLLVQEGPVGGECTFTGCVPSKALIEAAAWGAGFDEATAHVRRTVEAIAATEDDEAIRREGAQVLHGRARFVSPTGIEVDGRRIRSKRFVVATGSRPALPAVEGIDCVDCLTNENVFDLTRRPSTLVVVGGGPVGCELAQAFARLGTRVTVVEALDRLLPREEPEASTVLAGVFRDEGIDLRAGRQVQKVEQLGREAVRVHLDDGEWVEAERILVCMGRRPNTDGLDLDAAGVRTDRGGFIETASSMRTTARGVWAAGDVTGRLQFTHAAHEMGMIAAANALGRGRRRFDAAQVPWVVFTDPEVGRVGRTQAEAASSGGRVAFLPMSAVDRAVTAGRTEGFVKLVAGPRPLLRNAGGGRLYGATIVAPRAGEMIHEAALAMRTRMFTGRLAQTVHAYPTWSVAVRQAAAKLFEP